MAKVGDTIGRAFGKLANEASKKRENQGQAGGPVSHEWRRRQMLFDYGIDIGDEVKKRPVAPRRGPVKKRPLSDAEVSRRVEQAQSAVDRLNGNKNNVGPYALYSKPKNGDKRFGSNVLRIEKDFVKRGR